MSDAPSPDFSPTPPPIHAPPTVPGKIATGPREAGGLAIGSMVTGISGVVVSIFGIFCMLSPVGAIAGLVAVILGWVSLAKKKPRRGMAWTGVVTGVLAMILGIGYIGLFAYMIQAGSTYSTTSVNSAISRANAQSIGLGLVAYAANNRDALPPAAGWEQAVSPYVGGGARAPRVFISPNARGVTPSYIYVPVAKLSEADPGRVLVYENPAIAGELFAVVYADGHVENKSRKQLEAIISGLEKEAAK